MSDQFSHDRRHQQLGTPPDPPPESGSDHSHVDGPQGLQRPDDSTQTGHSGHRWMMLACCVPMLIIVAALIVTGVAGTGAIIFAAVCVGMMALMMAMPGGHGH